MGAPRSRPGSCQCYGHSINHFKELVRIRMPSHLKAVTPDHLERRPRYPPDLQGVDCRLT